MSRPCKYCLAAYPVLFENGDVPSCESGHRDEQRVYALAAAMARIFQPRPNTDEQVGWFLQDADAVVDDFDPPPAKWKLRKLPDGKFEARFRINGVTYVTPCGGTEKTTPVRLATLRSWQRRRKILRPPCQKPGTARQIASEAGRDRECHCRPSATGLTMDP
jgi:hypothetical protein